MRRSCAPRPRKNCSMICVASRWKPAAIAWPGSASSNTTRQRPCGRWHGLASTPNLSRRRISPGRTTARGRGPTGTAIRTGEAQVAQNVESNPVVAPWLEELLKYGFKSSHRPAAQESIRRSSASSYSTREPDAFGPEEVVLSDAARRRSCLRDLRAARSCRARSRPKRAEGSLEIDRSGDRHRGRDARRLHRRPSACAWPPRNRDCARDWANGRADRGPLPRRHDPRCRQDQCAGRALEQARQVDVARVPDAPDPCANRLRHREGRQISRGRSRRSSCNITSGSTGRVTRRASRATRCCPRPRSLRSPMWSRR